MGITVTLIDTHAPDRNAAAVAATVTDTLVPTTPDTLSLRAAEACGLFLQTVHAPQVRLVVNRFRWEDPRQPSLREMIDSAGLRLMGVIPDDPEMAAAQEKGVLAKEAAEDNTIMAFRNIALRFCGEVAVPCRHGRRMRGGLRALPPRFERTKNSAGGRSKVHIADGLRGDHRITEKAPFKESSLKGALRFCD